MSRYIQDIHTVYTESTYAEIDGYNSTHTIYSIDTLCIHTQHKYSLICIYIHRIHSIHTNRTWTDRQRDGWTGRWMGGWTDRQGDGGTDRWMDGWMDGQTD